MRNYKLMLLGIILVLFSCKKKTATTEGDEIFEYRSYIAEISKGVISAEEDVKVVLAKTIENITANEELDDDVLTVSPSVSGKVIALNDQTIAFVPETKFEQDTEYTFTLNLERLIKEVPEEHKEFTFKVKTLKQQINVITEHLQSYSKEWQYVEGVLRSSDVLSLEMAKKLIKASQEGEDIALKFEDSSEKGTSFSFKIDSIKRKKEDTKLMVSWDGAPFNIESKDDIEIAIPGKDNFVIVDVKVVNAERQYLEINFSDPVKSDQEFKGLVAIAEVKKLRFSVKGNVLRVYPNVDVKGAALLEVFQGIKSVDGFKLKETYSQSIAFEELKPEIRFIQSGTILPSSNNLKVNFEAVSLKAVDVTVLRIYENNILQFLQEQNLSGGGELRRVSRPVAKKTIQLENELSKSSRNWKAFAVDLNALITPEKGAIYRVIFSFKPSYSTYTCSNTNFSTEETQEENFDEEEDEGSYWDNAESYYNSDYDWYERDNPCHTSYYYNKKVATNVLASDLGVVIKKGTNKSFFASVNNIVTTQPIEGATVTFYNYQQQELGTKVTDVDGTTFFDADAEVYFAVVSHNNEKTYIKLNEGNVLSVSKFDVSGVKLHKGLKGFIYGERGVWRPGDDIYLTFMLEDNANPLPKGHPIKLELIDPYGQTTNRIVQRSGINNVYNFTVSTSSEEPTGNWQAKISVGGATFVKTLKIETIKPNRLKIKADFDADLITNSKPVKGHLAVKWLHGAIAKNLAADVTAKFSAVETKFKKFPGYIFDDPSKRFTGQEQVVFDGEIDAEGKADFMLKTQLSKTSPGMLKASFITKVYEEGGDFSTDVFSKPYSPYQTYVGISVPKGDKARGMLLTDVKQKFEIVTVGENGRAKAVKNVEVNIYKIRWRWWWETSEDNLSGYNSSSYKEPVYNTTVSTNASGKGTFEFELKYPDWGRYLVIVKDPNGKHSAGKDVYIDWPGWAGKSRKNDPSTASMLMISTDKTNYQVGEKAIVTFPSGDIGRALVTIENGSEVLESLWVTPEKGETKFELPIKELYSPNVYINITLLQPHGATANDLPIRMYGMVPIQVEDPVTKLAPVIKMPDVLEPEEKITVKVSESDGKAMTYTLAIVDEGLLDLTRFKTPNPWSSFYAREALGVKTWDIYDDVIGAFGGRIDQIFAIGGDDEAAGANNKKANRFKPMVIYKGPFYLKAGETRSHNIAIPKYVGSVRTMVIAGNNTSSAYGRAEKTTPVRKPLMLLASLPRKVSPGEKVRLPITVFAMEKKVKNVTVKVKTSKGFKIVGSKTQQLKFTEPDEKMTYFDLEITNDEGVSKVTIEASGNGEKASYEVEIDVVNPNPKTTKGSDIVLAANGSQTISLETFGITGSNTAQIELSTLPSMDFTGRMKYLIKYPHGCVEQTTSGAFPQLYLADIFELSSEKKAKIEGNIKKGIKRLSNFQRSNGGLSYWPGQSNANDWGTSYAGHFLLEAEQKGYVLPIGFKSKWIAYQKQKAKQWRKNSNRSDLSQAYRLYTLALSESADVSAMNRLRETNDLSDEAKHRLAAAYALIGQSTAAKTLFEDGGSGVTYTSTSSYSNTYGSLARNRAMALEATVLLKDMNKAQELAKIIAKGLSEKGWMSTQTTAYSLMAMAKFANLVGGKGIHVKVSVNGKNSTVKSAKTLAESGLTIKKGSNTITLNNKEGNAVFVKVLNSGILPIGEEEIVVRNLNASVRYVNKSGNSIAVTSLSQGTNFIAEVKITNTKAVNVKDVALAEIFPSGWEIINTRFTDFGSFADNKVEHTDIRDDRVNFYFDLKANQTKTFRILLNASYLGSYYIPGIQCEAMYDNDFAVHTKGKWVKVVK